MTRNFDMNIQRAMEIAKKPEDYPREKVEVALIILSQVVERAMAAFEQIRGTIPPERTYI